MVNCSIGAVDALAKIALQTNFATNYHQIQEKKLLQQHGFNFK